MAKKRTQKKLAEELGISRQYLNLILHGKMRPGIKLAEKISQELDIPFFDLRPDIRDIYRKYM